MNTKTRMLASSKPLFLLAVVATILTVGTGIIENAPQVGWIDTKYYGYPLVWRITQIDAATEINFPILILDIAFWFFVIIIILTVIKKKLTPT